MFNCPICGGRHKYSSKIGQEHGSRAGLVFPSAEAAAEHGEDHVIQDTIAEAAGLDPSTMSEWAEPRVDSMTDFVHDAGLISDSMHDAIVKQGGKTIAVDYKTAPAPKPKALAKLPKKEMASNKPAPNGTRDASVRTGETSEGKDSLGGSTPPARNKTPRSNPGKAASPKPSKIMDANLHEKDVMKKFPPMQRVRPGDIKDEEWQPLLKSKQMIRMNEEGGAVKRYMTPREELEFAKSIALAKGEKWSWLKERARLKALKKMDKGRVTES